jgi:hypothetical protein
MVGFFKKRLVVRVIAIVTLKTSVEQMAQGELAEANRILTAY